MATIPSTEDPAATAAVAPIAFEPIERTVRGLRVQLRVAGQGRPVLLLHGWPFTSWTWRQVAAFLVQAGFQVIAPDLRGTGRRPSGYDLRNTAEDALALLDVLGVPQADVVGTDLGAPIAFMLALRHPARVRRLALMEAWLGRLPGAEGFLAEGPPWWFGFHRVPGLAEAVLEGHEREYLGWFFSARAPTHRAVDAEAQAFFVQAYTGREALRGGFAHYRAMPEGAAQLAEVLKSTRLAMPTLAIAGGVVGDALHRQLQGCADDLHQVSIPDCGHNVAEEQPEPLARALISFFSEAEAATR